MLKKLAISTLLFFVLFTRTMLPFSVAKANAQTWYAPEFGDWYLKVYDTQASPETEIFGERYTAAQVTWVIYGIISFFINMVNDNFGVCLFSRATDNCANAVISINNDLDNYNATMLAQSGSQSVFDEFTSRPISGITYFKDIGAKLHLIPEAKAQGFGFTAGGSVLELWRVSRNITYALMVVAILIMAFMIMFRVKISPQTVITVQSALPKIVISLILITFSYAIVGFLIDLMYVVIGLISTLLINSVSNFNWSDMFQALTQRSAFELGGSYLLLILFMLIPFMIVVLAIPGLGVAVFLFLLIAAIILIFVIAIKIAWLLLKTYVMILLKIITGPFLILLGTISPGGGGIGSWLKSILADLAVYPTVGLMFVLSFVFLRAAFPNAEYFVNTLGMSLDLAQTLETGISDMFPLDIIPMIEDSTWSPPLTTFSGATALINLGVSFVMFTLIPSTAEIIKSAISGKPFAMGTAIGAAVSGGAAYVGYGTSKLSRAEIPIPGGGVPQLPGGIRGRIGAKVRGDLLKPAAGAAHEYGSERKRDWWTKRT